MRLVGERDGALGALLDEENGEAGIPDLRQRCEDDVDDLRREPERRLVEQQDLRVGGQRTPDCELLLLATRQHTRLPGAELAQDRKELVGSREAVAVRARSAAGEAEAEVLLHRELAEDAASLWYERHAAPRHLFRPASYDRCPVEPDVTAGDRGRAHDRMERRRLPGAVRPNQPDDLPGTHLERQAADSLDRSEPDREVLDH